MPFHLLRFLKSWIIKLPHQSQVVSRLLSFTKSSKSSPGYPIARKQIKMHIPNHKHPLEETLPDYIDPNSAAAKSALSKQNIHPSKNVGNQLISYAKCISCGYEPASICRECTLLKKDQRWLCCVCRARMKV